MGQDPRRAYRGLRQRRDPRVPLPGPEARRARRAVVQRDRLRARTRATRPRSARPIRTTITCSGWRSPNEHLWSAALGSAGCLRRCGTGARRERSARPECRAWSPCRHGSGLLGRRRGRPSPSRTASYTQDPASCRCRRHAAVIGAAANRSRRPVQGAACRVRRELACNVATADTVPVCTASARPCRRQPSSSSSQRARRPS